MAVQELIKVMRFLKYFLILIIISSCKPIKNINSSNINLNEDRLSPKQVIRKVSKSKSKFKSFQSKIKIKLNDKGSSKSYSANIRIIKDKAIWLSSTAGIVRVLITKDSLFYYNKLQKNYLKSSFNKIDEIIGVNLSYETIERLLLSEPVNKINKSDFNYFNNADDSYIFDWSIITTSSQRNKNMFEGVYFINSKNFKINQYSFKIKVNRDNFDLYELSYFDFNEISNQVFPLKINIYKTNFERLTNLQENNVQLNLDNYEGILSNEINIEFKSIKLNNKFKLPFKIPSNYKKIQINVE